MNENISSQQIEIIKSQLRNELRNEMEQLRNDMIQFIDERVGRIEQLTEILDRRIPENSIQMTIVLQDFSVIKEQNERQQEKIY